MSINQDSSLLDRWRDKSVDQFVPLQASLELTNRCNERCVHCYIDDFSDDPNRILSLQDWYKVLDELRSAGTLYLVLMGGEAMLNPHFWDIATRASKLGFHVSMISNGLKIRSQKIADRLKSSGVHQITFSLYSLKPSIHELMTSVKGSLQKTLNAISFCRSAGVEVSINSLLTTLNIKTIFELEDWCVKNKFDLKVDPTITSKLSGDLSPTKLRASRQQLTWFYEERARRWKNAKLKPVAEPKSGYVCNAAKGKCAVTAYGELLPCIEVRKPLGNLVDSPFEDLWHGPGVKKWRDIRFKDLKRKSASGFCEHCPGMANNEIGDYQKELDFSVMLSEVKEKVSQQSEI